MPLRPDIGGRPLLLIGVLVLGVLVGLVRANSFYTTQINCDDGWVRAYNSCYYFNTRDQVTWQEARQECIIQNSDLMIVRNTDEMGWINIQTEEYKTDEWWVGLQYTDHWTWLQYGGDTSIINWRAEPDNYDDQDCFGIDEYGAFSDEFCTSQLGFICRYAIQRGQVCPNATGWFMSDIACYYVSQLVDTSQHLTWEASKTYCLNLAPNKNIELLRVTSAQEMSFVTKLLAGYDTAGVLLPWWTGLNDLETEGTFVWQDGSPSNTSFMTWGLAPTADRSQHRDCGVMYQGGVIEDVTCDKRAHYACEKSAYVGHVNDGCGSWTRGGNSCYWFGRGKRYTWQQSRALCQRGGGDLIKIDNLDEQYWLKLTSNAHPGSGYWLGLNDQLFKTQWRWADGSLSDPALLNWGREPNNAGGSEHCAIIYRSGYYNDVQCVAKFPYICEYSKNYGVPCPPSWIARDTGCYYFSPANDSLYLTWYEVKDKCKDLVIGKGLRAYRLAVNDKTEQTWIKQQLLTLPPGAGAYWTGLNDLKTHFTWQYDEAFNNNYDETAIQWASEPNNYDGKEDCVLMLEGGSLNDAACNSTAYFICEKLAYTSSAGSTLLAGNVLHRWFPTFALVPLVLSFF